MVYLKLNFYYLREWLPRNLELMTPMNCPKLVGVICK